MCLWMNERMETMLAEQKAAGTSRVISAWEQRLAEGEHIYMEKIIREYESIRRNWGVVFIEIN